MLLSILRSTKIKSTTSLQGLLNRGREQGYKTRSGTSPWQTSSWAPGQNNLCGVLERAAQPFLPLQGLWNLESPFVALEFSKPFAKLPWREHLSMCTELLPMDRTSGGWHCSGSIAARWKLTHDTHTKIGEFCKVVPEANTFLSLRKSFWVLPECTKCSWKMVQLWLTL